MKFLNELWRVCVRFLSLSFIILVLINGNLVCSFLGWGVFYVKMESERLIGINMLWITEGGEFGMVEKDSWWLLWVLKIPDTSFYYKDLRAVIELWAAAILATYRGEIFPDCFLCFYLWIKENLFEELPTWAEFISPDAKFTPLRACEEFILIPLNRF